MSFEDSLFTARVYKRNYRTSLFGQLLKARYSPRPRDSGSAQERGSSLNIRSITERRDNLTEDHVYDKAWLGQTQKLSQDAENRGHLNQYLEIWEQSPRRSLAKAVRDSRPDIVRILLDYGAREGRPQPMYSEEGSSLLRIALRNKDINMTNLLKKYGALTAKENGYTQLQAAARAGDLKAMNTLLDAGAPVDCSDEHGFQPLHVVSMDSDMQDHIALLCNRGADVEATIYSPGDLYGFTPLQLACFRGQTRNVRTLLSHGATLVHGSKVANRPLYLTIKYSHVSTMRALLAHDPNPSFCRFQSALGFLAGLAGDKKRSLSVDKEIINILLEHGADLKATDAVGNHVLHHLSCRKWSEEDPTGSNSLPDKYTSLPFLDLGGDVNAINRKGESPLYLAAHSLNIPLAKGLLGQGAQGPIHIDTESMMKFHETVGMTEKQLSTLHRMMLLLGNHKVLVGDAGRCHT